MRRCFGSLGIGEGRPAKRRLVLGTEMSWFDMRGRNLLPEKILRIVCLESLRKASRTEVRGVLRRAGVPGGFRSDAETIGHFPMPDRRGIFSNSSRTVFSNSLLEPGLEMCYSARHATSDSVPEFPQRRNDCLEFCSQRGAASLGSTIIFVRMPRGIFAGASACRERFHSACDSCGRIFRR